MVRPIFAIAATMLVLLAACAVQESAPPKDNESDELPTIDDVTIDKDINDTTAALEGALPDEDVPEVVVGGRNGTEVKPVEKPVEAQKPTATAPEGAVRKEVIEGQLISFPNLKATDPDGDKLTYTFEKPLNEDGEWQTKVGDEGEYLTTITVSDGENVASQKVFIVVKAANKAPVIDMPSVVSAKEGEVVTLPVKADDSDGDKVSVTFSGWMTTKSKQATFTDAGDHSVIVTATDGKLSSSKNVTVRIENVNRAPVISPIEAVEFDEGEKVVVQPLVTDPDGDTVTVTFSKPLDERGTWQTRIGDGGSYDVTVTATDGKLTETAMAKVVLIKVNKAPVITLSDVTVDEGVTVNLVPTVVDPENDKVAIVYSGWMNSDTKATGYDDAGSYDVTVTATDTVGNSVKKSIKVTVKDVNRAPVFDPSAFA